MSKIKFHRKCPTCNQELEYSTKWSCIKADEKNKECKSCSKSGNKNPYFGKTGKENPFYGKKHTDNVKKIISERKIGKSVHTQSRKDFLSKEMSKNNPMAGKSFYDTWVSKYGKDIADQKLMEYKKAKSEKYSGSGNPMYGRVSPQGSGNGWSGWYNGWYFRSILELSFVINYLERFNMKWESAESNKFKIQYTDCIGHTKNYFPDFIVSNKYLIECKPEKLVQSKNVLLKKKAAEEFCFKHGLKYKIISPIILSESQLKDLYFSKKIKFLKKYEKKFIARYM